MFTYSWVGPPESAAPNEFTSTDATYWIPHSQALNSQVRNNQALNSSHHAGSQGGSGGKIKEEEPTRNHTRVHTIFLLAFLFVLRLSGRGHFNSRDLGRRPRKRLRSRAMNWIFVCCVAASSVNYTLQLHCSQLTRSTDPLRYFCKKQVEQSCIVLWFTHQK